MQTRDFNFARIIRGINPEDFYSFTDDPSRELVMAASLKDIAGLSRNEALLKLGYYPDYLAYKVSQGYTFKLVCFNEEDLPFGKVLLATWENVIRMMELAYPQLGHSLSLQIPSLKSTRFEVIQTMAEFNFLEVEKNGSEDPFFMTLDKFILSSRDLVACRALLYYVGHFRELYRGDGHTYDDKGNLGVDEYIMRNCLLSQLKNYRIEDIVI